MPPRACPPCTERVWFLTDSLLSAASRGLGPGRARSDWYVISSFIFAFSIIFVQTLAELGIYDEDAGAFRWGGGQGGGQGSLATDASASSGTLGEAGWAEAGWAEEGPITVPAPLVYGVCVWWGFHVIVMCIWGFFYARRMFIDPRKRDCMGRRWGAGGIDWYEPEINSMRNLLIHILPGGSKQPPAPTRQPTNRRPPPPGGLETQLTSGVSTELSSLANSHANSPRNADIPSRGIASPAMSPARLWGAEGYCGTASSPAVRM